MDQLPVGEERANLSVVVVYLYLCGFCLERLPLPQGAWDGLRYFIVAIPEPSINYSEINSILFTFSNPSLFQ